MTVRHLLLVAAMLGLVLSSCTAPQQSSPSPPPTSDPTVGAQDTLFGASFQRKSSESYSEALSRTDRSLGLEVVRVFYPGAPQPWPGVAPDRDVVVSFKLPPEEVVQGQHDEAMTEWFAAAPRDRRVYWVYWHEPEDDSETGTFTPDEYRRAFAHLDALADRAGNRMLSSTVVLMSYSVDEASGRDWRLWFPPVRSVDVLAWDVYNRGTGSTFYEPPEEMLGPLREASASVGKPFGVAELGSPRQKGDPGRQRAAWLTSVGCYLVEHDARFVAYFDFLWNNGRDDYRLRDKPSRAAWRELGSLVPDDRRCAGA